MGTNQTSPVQPFVSVVTPFYNTARYLAECIESVLGQSYDNWEYVLLDNCSTDGSHEIAEQYATKDPRIRLFRNTTLLPQVQNYNMALSYISTRSDYCKVVQADDWIYPECLQRMVALAESDPSIGIVSSYSLWGDRVLGAGLPYHTTVMPGSEVCRLQLRTSLFFFGSPTTVMYRAKIIRATPQFFDPSTLHDDTDACYRVLRTWKFGFVHQILSFSRVEAGSIMSRAQEFGAELLDRLLQVCKFGCVFLQQNELADASQASRRRYYRFLARRLLARSSSAFWEYQKSCLRSGGQRLDKLYLFRQVCCELLRLLTNPGSTARYLSNRWAKAETDRNQPASWASDIPLPTDVSASRDNR